MHVVETVAQICAHSIRQTIRHTIRLAVVLPMAPSVELLSLTDRAHPRAPNSMAMDHSMSRLRVAMDHSMIVADLLAHLLFEMAARPMSSMVEHIPLMESVAPHECAPLATKDPLVAQSLCHSGVQCSSS